MGGNKMQHLTSAFCERKIFFPLLSKHTAEDTRQKIFFCWTYIVPQIWVIFPYEPFNFYYFLGEVLYLSLFGNVINRYFTWFGQWQLLQLQFVWDWSSDRLWGQLLELTWNNTMWKSKKKIRRIVRNCPPTQVSTLFTEVRIALLQTAELMSSYTQSIQKN